MPMDARRADDAAPRRPGRRAVVEADDRGRAGRGRARSADEGGDPVLVAGRWQQPGRRRRGVDRPRRPSSAPRARRRGRLVQRRVVEVGAARRGTTSSPGRSSAAGSASRPSSGIPGTAGATPIQNVGAYGQEVAQTIARVRIWDRVRPRDPHLRRGRLRLRLPHQPLQAGPRPLRRALRDLPAPPRRPRRPGRSTPSWPAPWASRSASGRPRPTVREAVLDAAPRQGRWCSTPTTTTPGAPAPSSPTRSSPPPRLPLTGAPPLAAARRHGQDQRRLADRARRLRQGPRQRPGVAVHQAHARPHQPRRRDHRRAAGPRPRDPRRRAGARSASSWSTSRCSSAASSEPASDVAGARRLADGHQHARTRISSSTARIRSTVPMMPRIMPALACPRRRADPARPGSP